MNRIILWDDDQALESNTTQLAPLGGLPGLASDSEGRLGTGEPPRQRSNLEHCLFGPRSYEPNYSYPLIVWIHGPDDNEQQLNQVMPHISLQNFVGVSPRGTLLQDSYPNGVSTYTWEHSPDQIVTALDRVVECIDLARMRLNIDTSRIFLAGYDVGGTMALRLAWASPKTFAGVASFGGSFPKSHSPLRNFDDCRELPLMMAYGRDGVDYGDVELQDDLRLLHSAGFQKQTIRQYPCGDELVTQMLKDFNSWVMKLVNGYDMNEAGNTDYQMRFENPN